MTFTEWSRPSRYRRSSEVDCVTLCWASYAQAGTPVQSQDGGANLFPGGTVLVLLKVFGDDAVAQKVIEPVMRPHHFRAGYG